MHYVFQQPHTNQTCQHHVQCKHTHNAFLTSSTKIFTLSLLQIVYRSTRSAPKRVDVSESQTSRRMHFINRAIGKLSNNNGSVFNSYIVSQ